MSTLTTIGAFLLFATFGVGIWCLSQLHGHVDEEKIRSEPSIGATLKQAPLPARVLTEKGRKMRKVGLAAFVSALIIFLAMFIARLLYPL